MKRLDTMNKNSKKLSDGVAAHSNSTNKPRLWNPNTTSSSSRSADISTQQYSLATESTSQHNMVTPGPMNIPQNAIYAPQNISLMPEGVPVQTTWADVVQRSTPWNPTEQSETIPGRNVVNPSNTIKDNQMWRQHLPQDNRIWNPPNPNLIQNPNWRSELQLLRGNGNNPGNRSPSIAADVDLVVYNIAKNVSATQVKNHLANKGLHIKDCTLLTTSEEARMLSYKITVRPEDTERATTDQTLWPNGVGVRFYKHFKGPRARNVPASARTQGVQSNSSRTLSVEGRSPWLIPGLYN